jgi:hypothetical protein
LTSESLIGRWLPVAGLAMVERCAESPLDDSRCGIGGGVARTRLRMANAPAAAAPAASSIVPASTFGQRRLAGAGGSSLRAVAASIAETFGPILSCIETLPLAALTAIQARTRPTLGLALVAAPPARRRAVMVALLVIGLV